MSADLLRRAAETLRGKAAAATPPPWREGSDPTGRNKYAALVADTPDPKRPSPGSGGWDYDEEYGGCLIGESLMAGDRAHIAAMHPGVALALADWLDDEADYIPGREAVKVAHAIWGEAL